MSIKHKIRTFLWRIGYDLSRFTPVSHPLARRKQIFDFYNIDTVLDVGANSGGFALQLRNDLGYEKRIVSFEPLGSAFESLRTNAKGDANWEVLNFALGSSDELTEINIAGNSYSSSLLNMLPAHINVAPESRYIGKEMIEVKRLDVVFDGLCNPAEKIYMKIDTQGFESRVLAGAENSLKHIGTVQLEMSLTPLYEGELRFHEMCMFMEGKGYALISIEPGFVDMGSGQLLQVDGVFHRF